MTLNEIALKNFKNYKEEEIKLDRQITLLCGNNGSGKTNLLEAIYYLQTLKTLRQAELIQWGTPEGAILATKIEEERPIKYSILISNNERILKIGEKSIKRVEEFLKGSSIVAFLPHHLWIIKGGPLLRREYLDRAIFNGNFNYLHIIKEYRRILKQRNASIRQLVNSTDKEVWDRQLIKSAILVIKERQEFIKKIAPLVTEIYSSLSATKDILTLSYDMSRDAIVEGDDVAIQGYAKLRRIAQEERFRQYSLWGPHRHDLKILLNGYPLGVAGSQGGQRLGIIALKLAEIELLKQKGVIPLILLDDLASELDPIRRSLILSCLRGSQHQIVLTTCDPGQWAFKDAKTVTKYYIVDGKIKTIF